jgi:alkanesulfonate monooxygenase SsuD/methylene tetrahydromethanopterin reductase-like flavin-dependent oxidoreductase (luciferase family)
VSARLGVVSRPDFSPAALPRIAAAVDAAGIDELWLWEDCFLQGGIAAATAALAATDTLTVGIGVLPAPLRNVVTTAMEVASLEAMFPGRIRVGIGHGVQDWMRQAGAAVASPLTLLREYVTALGRLLAGESVSVDGRYVRLADVQLDWPPPQRLPVLIGGTGPKTLRLAGEIADGVVLDSQYSPVTLRAALEHVEAGRADRDGEPFFTVLFVSCTPGAHPGEIGVGGSIEEIAGCSAPYLDVGVHTLVLQPPASAESAMPDFVATVGEVAARLRSATR